MRFAACGPRASQTRLWVDMYPAVSSSKLRDAITYPFLRPFFAPQLPRSAVPALSKSPSLPCECR